MNGQEYHRDKWELNKLPNSDLSDNQDADGSNDKVGA
jgi:hypothetical protein